MVPAPPPASHTPIRVLEALDSLAGGLAHDLNNLLQAIRAFGDVAVGSVPADHPAREHLDAITAATSRAGELLRTLRAATTPPRLQRSAVELASLLSEVTQTLRLTLPATITLAEHHTAGGAAVQGDPARLRELMTHVVSNASTALRGEGVIQISSAVSATGPDGTLEPGEPGWLVLTVADDGPGMTPAVRARATDPYFTTWNSPRHPGLGLALAQQIAIAHGGALRIVSEMGAGTRIVVYLPASQSAAPSVAPRSARILYLDDEPALARLSVRLLHSMGHRVSAHTSPEEALTLFAAAPDAFDLVISDLSMPRMSGLDVAREVQRLRSGTPVILSSGHLEPTQQDLAHQYGVVAFLTKPTAREDLARTIAAVLQQQTDPAPE